MVLRISYLFDTCKRYSAFHSQSLSAVLLDKDNTNSIHDAEKLAMQTYTKCLEISEDEIVAGTKELVQVSTSDIPNGMACIHYRKWTVG